MQTLSQNLLRIPHLSTFLDSPIKKRSLRTWKKSVPENIPTAIVGWGHKPTADKARRTAKEQGIPYIALEDGFYRSLGLGCMGASPLSLVVDKSGIYYDATQVSDLENLLNSKGWESAELMQSAFRAMNTIITHNLSKYNHAPLAPSDFIYNLVRISQNKTTLTQKSNINSVYFDVCHDNKNKSEKNALSSLNTLLNHADTRKIQPLVFSQKISFEEVTSVNEELERQSFSSENTFTHQQTILLIDQTKGDASVTFGLANEQTFINMYHEAKQLYPNAFIAIKTHPDVLAGKKKGYLTELAKEKNILLIAQDFAPLSLLKQVDMVFTVTSQMGFDALLLTKEVHCFGMPFYAGWGLTHDHISSPEMRQCIDRRTKKRSIEELFTASCILYPCYVNPVTGKRTDIYEILELLVLQRQYNEENKGFHACIGFSWWKHAYPKAYLQSTQSQFRAFSKIVS